MAECRGRMLLRGSIKAEDIPDSEMRIYALLYDRWERQTAEQTIHEAATLFNLAVTMAGRKEASR